MPWSVKKDPRCGSGYAVVKDTDNELVACHKTKESAIDQQRALYASEANKAEAPESKSNNIWAGRFIKPNK
jgi:DNA-directed RNA polymerase subunit M/transcription elongation factor TFIIS